MLIYSRYWDSIWLPDNLVVGVASPLENRFSLILDKLAVRCPIAIEPIAECARYYGLLSAQPIDLCFLGIGETGHIAFNDPEVADFNDRYRVKLVKLADKSRQQQVNTGFFDRIEAVPQSALTLTLPTIFQARQIDSVLDRK